MNKTKQNKLLEESSDSDSEIECGKKVVQKKDLLKKRKNSKTSNSSKNKKKSQDDVLLIDNSNEVKKSKKSKDLEVEKKKSKKQKVLKKLSTESESESEEEVVQKKSKKVKKAKKVETESESESEEEVVQKKSKKVKKAKKVETESESESEEEKVKEVSESEEEEKKIEVAKDEEVVEDKNTTSFKNNNKQNNDTVNDEYEVIINGLSFKLSENDIKADFLECGEINHFKLLKNPDGSSRGKAFVKYSTKEGMDKALEFHKQEYGGRTIYIEKTVKKNNNNGFNSNGNRNGGKGQYSEKNSSLIVRNLPFQAEDKDLESFFKDSGDLKGFRIIKDEEGKSRGFGFVDFYDEDTATNALSKDGGMIMNRNIRLDYSIKKEKRGNFNSNRPSFGKDNNFRKPRVFASNNNVEDL